MQADHVTSLEEIVAAVHSMHPTLLDDVFRTIFVISIDVHIKALGNTGYIATDISEGQNAQFLAFQLRARLAIEEIADGEDKQAKDQFSHSVGVLSRSILNDNTFFLGISSVYGVITCTGSDNNLQVLGGVEHFFVDFIGTHDHGINICYCIEQLLLLLIFLKEHDLMSLFLGHLFNALHCCGSKRFLCCN